MCVICISPKGTRQPDAQDIMNMWTRNPHGAGYMFVKDGNVQIKKGFMDYESFLDSVFQEGFTSDDVVVYHFRISTQGGVNPEMTQPFAFTNELVKTKELDATTKLGIAHNGIIPMTTDYKDKEYSDTAHFVSEYLPLIVRKRSDLEKPETLEIIAELIQSKMALLDTTGAVTMIGHFHKANDGLLYSNLHHQVKALYR